MYNQNFEQNYLQEKKNEKRSPPPLLCLDWPAKQKSSRAQLLQSQLFELVYIYLDYYTTCVVVIHCCVRWINGDWNIFFAYAPSRINKNIHMTAIKFVKIEFLIQQLTLFFFSLLRGGLQGVAIFALVRFCVTLFLLENI